MKTRQVTYILCIILVFVFLFLAVFTLKLGFYLDDAVFSFPLKAGNFGQYAFGYLQHYSFFRPLALAYYYFIYNFYFDFLGVVHLVPLLIFLASFILIFQVLKIQGLDYVLNFFCLLLIIALPFWVEVYGWLAASNSLLVFFIFFLQVYLIEKKYAKKELIFILFFLQLAASLLYETTIFMPLALVFLWLQKQGKSFWQVKSFFNYGKKVMVLSLPAVLLLVLRIIFPPQVESRIRFISLLQLGENWQDFSQSLRGFFVQSAIVSFWLPSFQNGLNLILHSIYSLLAFALLFLGIVFIFFYQFPKTESRKTANPYFTFYLLVFLLTLIPLSFQSYYLPFRTLVLPLSFLIILFGFFFNRYFLSDHCSSFLSAIFKTGVILTISVCFVLQASWLTNYSQQYQDDLQLSKEIQTAVKYFELTSQSPHILLTNFPQNTLFDFAYGDYIFSTFHYYWSGQSFHAIETKKWYDFAMESQGKVNWSAPVEKEQFLKLRPLLILRFTDLNQCDQGKCFDVTEVKPK